MTAWWESMDLLSKILYCIAIPSGILLIIQTLLILIGFGDGGAGLNDIDTSGIDFDTGVDIDIPHHMDTGVGDGSSPGDFGDMRLFTLQGIVAFFTVFSWTSLASYHAHVPGAVSLIIGFFAGFAAMFGVAKLIQLSVRLESSGNISLKNALGETGRVYLPIRPKEQGKVSLTVQERLIEADAITDGEEVIPSGAVVRVVDVRAGILVVEKE